MSEIMAYEAILEKLGEYNFVVISEHKPKNTDSVEYTKKITEQATALLNAGVPAKHITIVGASMARALQFRCLTSLRMKK